MDDLWATKSEDVGLIVRTISFQDFNLCGHDPPTSQTDRQTTCDRKTALCTIMHRAAVKSTQMEYATTLFGVFCWCGQSLERKTAFIATQLPLDQTVGDFWHMCFDYRCQLIVCLLDHSQQHVRICRLSVCLSVTSV